MEGEPRESDERFGQYTLLRELGRGGQGSVWLAEDTKLSRHVALKLLNSGPGSLSDNQLARFRREAEAASRLDHTNICGLLDAGDVDGVPYLAFRYVSGVSLAQRIDSLANDRPSHASVPDGEVENDPSSKDGIHRIALIFEKIARALHSAHEVGLIHRDVKPGNIMVTDEGEPVVLDFGLAREEIGEEMSLTHSGDLIGTPAYMSPEQLMANRVPLDRRTDIYSLGASLYETLTLQRPFRALTRAELYQQILHSGPTLASSLNRQIPGDLQVVLQTAMEKDRDRRYQSALDFAEDLRRFREFEPIRARPIGKALRAKRWAQRHPTATVSLLLFAAGLLASVVALARISGELRTQTMLNLVGESRLILTVDPVSALELALRANDIVPGAKEAISQLHRVLAHGVPVASMQGGGVNGLGFWSGDGARFLHVNTDASGFGRVTSGDAGLVGLVPRFEDLRIDPLNCGFSSSGIYIYGIDQNGKLHVFNEDLRKSVQIDRPAENFAVSRALADDDRLLVQSSSGRLTLFDLVSGSALDFPADLPGVSSNIDVAPNGPTFAVGLTDATLAVFSDNELVARSPPLTAAAVRVAYAAATGRVVAVLPSGRAVSWTIHPASIEQLPKCDSALHAEFSHDGQSLVTFHASGVANLRDHAGAVLHVLERPDGSDAPLNLFNSVGSVTTSVVPRYFSNSQTQPRICTIYRDLATSIWDLHGSHVATIPGIPGYQDNWAQWSGDGENLLLSQGPPSVRVFDANGRLQARLAPAGKGSLSPDGSRVFVSDKLWALPDPDAPWVTAHRAIVRELAATGPDGAIVATASDDATARVWRRHRDGFEPLETFDATAPVVALDVDSTGDLVVIGSGDGRVQLRRRSDRAVLFDKQVVARREGYSIWTVHSITAVSMAPDGRRFAAAGMGKTHVYDVKSGAHLFSTPVAGHGVHLTDRYLLTAGGTIVGLFSRQGQLVQDFGGKKPWSGDARLSPDETVAVLARAYEIWIHEQAPTGEWPEEPSAILRGHDGVVWCVRFHPDGDRIVSTSNDGTARIWSVSERRELAILEGHEGPVRSAAFVDGGEKVITTGADGRVRTWFVDADDLIDLARRRLAAAKD